jgi:hypothetical protein
MASIISMPSVVTSVVLMPDWGRAKARIRNITEENRRARSRCRKIIFREAGIREKYFVEENTIAPLDLIQ